MKVGSSKSKLCKTMSISYKKFIKLIVIKTTKLMNFSQCSYFRSEVGNY